jgi:DNA repair protein RadC
MSSKNYHEGHRNRVRNKFLTQNIDNMPQHEVLEPLLFLTIPRGDTNLISHKLLEKFGSLSSVLGAPINQLMEVEGVGEQTAFWLHTLPDFFRYYRTDKYDISKPFDINIACSFLMDFYTNRHYESVVLMLLDSKQKLLYRGVINEGAIDSVKINNKKIIKIASSIDGARYAIISHNHPSGIAYPSDEDILSSYSIRDCLKTIQIEMVDHIVVSDGESVSMRFSAKILGAENLFDYGKETEFEDGRDNNIKKED